MEKTFETYEKVATYLLNKFKDKFGLKEVEGKQKIKGHKSDTLWEIDAKGISEDGEGFFIVECRRYTKSKQNQEKIAALAYKISDTKANGGIIVSPYDLQKGAKKIAKSENIITVKLSPNSSPTDFVMEFFNKIMAGVSDHVKIKESVIVVLTRNSVPKNEPEP